MRMADGEKGGNKRKAAADGDETQAAAEDVFAKQERLFTSGTGEMPS
jgi:hypothetical protein